MVYIASEEEVWEHIPGKLGLYEISNFGRVRSLPRPVEHVMSDGRRITRVRKARLLKVSKGAGGYLRVVLSDGVKYLHHLMLETFVCPRPIGQIALHFDDDPSNCALGNLRWGTFKENSQDAVRNGIRIGAPLGNKNAIGGKSALKRETP